MQKVSTCLWFDDKAEEAARFYTSVFPNSQIVRTTYYLEGAPRPARSVLTVVFTLNGIEYVALNGGPHFKLSPATSLVAYCESQEEVDRLWIELGKGGQVSDCGWLTDKFGLSWQVLPREFLGMLNTADSAASQRAVAAMRKMTKLDLAGLRLAYAGKHWDHT